MALVGRKHIENKEHSVGNILGVGLTRKNLRGISILKQIEISEIRNFTLKMNFSPKYHKTVPG